MPCCSCAGHWHRQFTRTTVDRPAGSKYVYLTFEGLRDSRTIADKHTRVRVALPVDEADRLLELLGQQLQPPA